MTTGTTSERLTVNFRWSPVAGATHYTLEVNGAQTRFSQPAATLIYPASFTSVRYFWKVRAGRDSTAGPWSATWTFNIERIVTDPVDDI